MAKSVNSVSNTLLILIDYCLPKPPCIEAPDPRIR